jgi:dynactin complex subunit
LTGGKTGIVKFIGKIEDKELIGIELDNWF